MRIGDWVVNWWWMKPVSCMRTREFDYDDWVEWELSVRRLPRRPEATWVIDTGTGVKALANLQIHLWFATLFIHRPAYRAADAVTRKLEKKAPIAGA